jgi:hypothetical protein
MILRVLRPLQGAPWPVGQGCYAGAQHAVRIPCSALAVHHVLFAATRLLRTAALQVVRRS